MSTDPETRRREAKLGELYAKAVELRERAALAKRTGDKTWQQLAGEYDVKAATFNELAEAWGFHARSGRPPKTPNT